MKWFAQVLPAVVVGYLMVGVAIALVGLFLKAWYLIFLMGWNAL